MEWGINTQTLNNIRRLTPEVIQLGYEDKWLTRVPTSYVSNCANRENSSICLDLTIEVIRRKCDHTKAVRTASRDKPYDMPTAYVGQSLFQFPKTGSKLLHTLQCDDKCSLDSELSGFESDKIFYKIECTRPDDEIIRGFIEKLDISLDE